MQNIASHDIILSKKGEFAMAENDTNSLMKKILDECREIETELGEVNKTAHEARKRADAHLKDHEAAVAALRDGSVVHLSKIVEDLEMTVNMK